MNEEEKDIQSEVVDQDERDIRISELEGLIFLQGNTIGAFQRRVYRLEMEIVELMSLIPQTPEG